MAPSATARIPGPDGLGPGERTALAKPWHARPTPRFVWWTSVWVVSRFPKGMKRLAAAVSFLSRVPLPREWEHGAEDVGRSTLLFPLVGAAIGAGACWF